MRAAILHDSSSLHTTTAHVLAALQHCCPEATLFSPEKTGEIQYLEGFDLVVSTSSQAARSTFLAGGTIHLSYVGPMNSTEGSTSPSTSAHLSNRSSATQAATRYIAASNSVRERIAREVQLPSQVIFPPINTAFFRPGPFHRENFYLTVCREHSQISAKDWELCINACRLTRRELVIIGPLSDEETRAFSAHSHVHCLGPQSDEMIRDCYQRCRALLFPTACDFAETVVEAQACGTPVITYIVGGVKETILDAEENGHGTGLFFHEPNAWSVASAIQELERRPQNYEPSLGCANAARFSISRFEREMLCLMEQSVQTADGANGWHLATSAGQPAGENDRHSPPHRSAA